MVWLGHTPSNSNHAKSTIAATLHAGKLSKSGGAIAPLAPTVPTPMQNPACIPKLLTLQMIGQGLEKCLECEHFVAALEKRKKSNVVLP